MAMSLIQQSKQYATLKRTLKYYLESSELFTSSGINKECLDLIFMNEASISFYYLFLTRTYFL